MTTPPPPHGNPADRPAEQPAWGEQPPGGWGEQSPEGPPGRDEHVDPRAWSQSGGDAASSRRAGGEGGGQQPYGHDPAGRPYSDPQQPYGSVPTVGQPQYDEPQYGRQQGQPPNDQPQYGQQQGQPQYGQPQYGQRQYGQPQYGQQQDQPQYGQPQYGQQPDYGQQTPYGRPAEQWGSGQQAWGPPDQPGRGQQGTPPTQQWGPGYPALPDSPSRPSPGPSKLPLILGGAGVLVVALVLVLGFVAPGYFVTRVFSATAVQDGVQKVLTDDYGLKVGSVTCAENVKVTEGAAFDCDAVIDGTTRSVPIRITSSDGRYEVGKPL